MLVNSLPELKANLGPEVEVEELSRGRAQVIDVIKLNPDLGQPVSRSLTDERAASAAARMGRFISVVEALFGLKSGAE